MRTTSLLLVFAAGVLAQGTKEDYSRAERVMNGSLRRLMIDGEIAPNWVGRSARFWYRKDLSNTEKQFLLVNAESNARTPAFDHEKLAAALGKATGKTYAANKLPFDDFTFARTERSIEANAEGSRWSCDLTEWKCVSRGPARAGRGGGGGGGRGGRGGGDAADDQPARPPGTSPDGTYVAFVRDHDLWVKTVVTNQEFQLTKDGTELQPYATGWENLGDQVRGAGAAPSAGPQGIVQGPPGAIVTWSPDSTKIATFRLDMRSAPPAYALQVSPPNQFMPKMYRYAYAFPPSPVLPTASPIIFNVKTGARIDIEARPQEILYGGGIRPTWFRDSRGVYFRETDRGFTAIRMLAADANTGKVKVMVEEKAKDWVVSSKFLTRLIKDGEEILVSSERDGWHHLYLYDSANNMKTRITSGEWVVRSVEHVDEQNRVIYFTGGGRENGEDPYLRHLYRVNFDGRDLRMLTPENADHSPVFSPDGKYLVDIYSRVDMAPVSVLRRSTDGKVGMELEKSDITKLTASGWKQPERFKAIARDGKTDIYGVLWRPSNFDPSKKYPVVENIYSGPHSFFTPVSFNSAVRHGCQVYAELGFLCVMIDGMGTSGRSKAFHLVSHKNLGDGGLPDHIAAMKQLAAKYPYMDLNRVGIFGHSAGGYNSTNALLTHPEFYKVAVSSAGNHDHRLDKAGWVEQWMSYPAGKHYEEQSNITLAPKLQGKLLLAVGDLDDNVTPFSTLKLSAALIEAGKDHELVIMPNRFHGFGGGAGGDFFTKKRWDYFVKHLMNVEPPAFKLGEQKIETN